jgi:hypothetical protein
MASVFPFLSLKYFKMSRTLQRAQISSLSLLNFESQLVKSFATSDFLRWASRLLPFYLHIFYFWNASEISEDTQIEMISLTIAEKEERCSNITHEYNEIIYPILKDKFVFLDATPLRVSLTFYIVMCNISTSCLLFSNRQKNLHNEARFKPSLLPDKYYRSNNGDGGEVVIAGHNLISLSVRCATKLLRPFERGII